MSPVADRSRSRTAILQCRCGASVEHQYWDVIDEAQRPDLARQLARGELGRVRCAGCGRDLYADEPVIVIRTQAATPVRLVFSSRPLEESEIPQVAGTEDMVWIGLPPEAPAVVLERDLDADLSDLEAARAEVSERHGPAAGLGYRESLRALSVRSTRYDVFGTLAALADLDEVGFRRLIADEPGYLSDDFQGAVDRICLGFPEQAGTLQTVGDLMLAARTDPSGALRGFEADLSRREAELERIAPVLEQLAAAADAGRLDEVVARGPTIVEEAQAIGAVLAAGVAADIVGGALAMTTGPRRREDLEQAIRYLSDAVAYADTEVQRAFRRTRLSNTYITRFVGDRRRNVEESVALLREAMRTLGDADPGLLAWIQTNLAYALSLREDGDRVDNLIEGYHLCKDALTRRSVERDVVNWAYTQINLGMTIEGLAAVGRARYRDARRAWEAVLEHEHELPPDVAGTARINLERMERSRPRRAVTVRGRRRSLQAARERLAGQLAGLQSAGPLARGRALRELASLDVELGERSAAIEHYQAALQEVRPELSPRECQEIGSALGSMLAEDGRWPEAAAAFSDALAAADLLFYGRATAADREAESRARGNLSRWAAFALARAGDARRAALVLEDGRARELRLRLGADDEQRAALEDAAPQLYAAYEQALADLARADLVDDADAAATRHEQLLERIRAVSGLEQFGGPATWALLASAVTDDEPLMYVNPTPWGTLLLTLSGDGSVRSGFLEITSTTIVNRLVFGVEEGRPVGPSYLAAASGNGTGIDRALRIAFRWVGESLADRVASELRATSATRATLLVSGPLAQFPIHLAPRPTDDDSVGPTLADEFDIKFAPSAALHGAARRRAVERARAPVRPVLVAVADPRAGARALPGARVEVRELARLFSSEDRHVAVGPDATSAFLREHASEATYLHLACHASGATFGYRGSIIELADGDLPLTDLSRIGPLTSRVAIASACQSGMPDADLAEEGYSIAVVLLAAGSATAIASLWPIPDVATAILMTKLYEELPGSEPSAPSQALRRAQVWLRDLPRPEVEAFIDAHPTLRDEAAPRRGSGDEFLPSEDQPFADPSYWAAFIAMGP